MNNHEINDKAKADEHKGTDAGLNLVSLLEGDKTAGQGIEATQKAIEAVEHAIKAQMEKIGLLAMRAVASLENCGEPHHMEALKEAVCRGAAKNEPGYVEFQKHLKA